MAYNLLSEPIISKNHIKLQIKKLFKTDCFSSNKDAADYPQGNHGGKERGTAVRD